MQQRTQRIGNRRRTNTEISAATKECKQNQSKENSKIANSETNSSTNAYRQKHPTEKTKQTKRKTNNSKQHMQNTKQHKQQHTGKI